MSVRKFLFDESFDVEVSPRVTYAEDDDLLPEPVADAAVEEPAAPPPPVFSEEELAAARAEGHAQGFAEGESAGRSAGYGQGFTEGLKAGQSTGYETARQEIEAQVNSRIAQALSQIADGVARLIAEREATNAMRSDQPVHIALAVVRKLMPELARRGGLQEVEAMIRNCLTDLIDEPRLVVRVAEDTVDLVRDHLDQAISSRGFGARLMVIGDPAMAPGSCRVEWAEGGMERDTARLLADVERCAARFLEAPAPV